MGIASGVVATPTVVQPVHDLLNANANIQIADADVGPVNPVPTDAVTDTEVVQPTHDDLNANVNIQVGDADVGAANPVPVVVETTQTIQRAAISVAGAGDNTIVAAAVGLQTKVLGIILIASGAVGARFENGAGGPALTGVMSLACDGTGFVLPVATPHFYHWFETGVNTLLNLELSAAVQVSGCIVYLQE